MRAEKVANTLLHQYSVHIKMEGVLCRFCCKTTLQSTPQLTSIYISAYYANIAKRPAHQSP